MKKAYQCYFSTLVFSLFLSGCVPLLKSSAEQPTSDRSALSILGVHRLTLLQLGDWEKSNLENYLQGRLADNKTNVGIYTLPRNDGSTTTVNALVSTKFLPQANTSLHCKVLSLTVSVSARENVANEGVMCWDALQGISSSWKRHDEVVAPEEVRRPPQEAEEQKAVPSKKHKQRKKKD